MAPAHDITLRPAGAEDIPVTRDLAGSIWREHYPGIITHAQIDYMLERMYAARRHRALREGSPRPPRPAQNKPPLLPPPPSS